MRTYDDFVPTFERAQWTFPDVLRHYATTTPDTVCLELPAESATWTYAQALESAERIGRNLLAGGAEAGDRLIIMAANSSQFLRSWFGSAVAGMVEVPINTAYEHDFLAHQVATVAARWAVIDDVHAEKFVAVREAASTIERFWIVDTGQRDAARSLLTDAGWSVSDWEDLESPVSTDIELPTVRPSDLASIFFTSGTTGPSKGVAMPHAQMYFFADECVSMTRMTADDVWMTVTPLFHGNAQFMATFPALVAGGRAVVHPRFSASRWVDQLRDSNVTVTNLIGVMMDFLAKQEPRADDADNRLRAVFAAPTAAGLVPHFTERFGIETFVEAFGLTETSAPIMAPYGQPRPAGAAGLAMADWFDVRLVDPETDEEVPTGTVGELVIRPRVPWISSMGYYAMPEKTLEAWRNLWFHTGDALRKDQEGWFYFVDRFKDALRRRGENISSYEVETALLTHPGVVEAAVIAVPAPYQAGEDEVMAYLITRPGVTADEVWEHAAGRIPGFAIPRYLRFVDTLPKTPSERVQKAKLRELGVTDDTHDREARVGATS